jgi:hypothetical protein
MRAWAALKDSDKNVRIVREQLEEVNKEVKMFREVLKILLMHSMTFSFD